CAGLTCYLLAPVGGAARGSGGEELVAAALALSARQGQASGAGISARCYRGGAGITCSSFSGLHPLPLPDRQRASISSRRGALSSSPRPSPTPAPPSSPHAHGPARGRQQQLEAVAGRR
ncbi:unnamed protein product, partial [Urochloa humidicola]